MSKYVRETAAGKSVSAYVILKAGKEIATVQAYYSNGGRVLVNVFQNSKAAERSAKARKVDPSKAYDAFHFQHASASGYGYDKFTAALSGLIIDGHEMTDHCSRLKAPKPPKGRTTFPRDYKAPKGYRLANYHYNKHVKNEAGDYDLVDLPESERGYSDCYRLDGLKYLEAIGYQVIQAI